MIRGSEARGHLPHHGTFSTFPFPIQSVDKKIVTSQMHVQIYYLLFWEIETQYRIAGDS